MKLNQGHHESKLIGFTIDYYSAKWGGYTLDHLNEMIGIAKPLLEPIFDLVPNQGGYILDIGTGPGTIPFAFVKMRHSKDYIRIMGIDPSQPAINFANQMAIEFKVENFVKFRLGTFEDIPFPDNTFDVVISNASFNLSTQKEEAVQEMYRVVKDEGIVIIADCFRKKGSKVSNQCNTRLWAICVSGAIEINWLISYAKSIKLRHIGSMDLTHVVTALILEGKWNWKEFIDFDLEYSALKFIKTKGERT
jgi:SAM-dependent methyltransferase